MVDQVNLFLTLLTAHFLADFPLQTNIIYKWKTLSPWGVVFHSGIFTLCALMLCFSVLNAGIIFLIFFLSVIHFFTDWSKLKIPEKHDNLFIFLLDQLAHVVTIIIGIWLLKLLFQEQPLVSVDKAFLIPHDYIGLVLGLIITSYVGVILVYYLEKLILNSNPGLLPFYFSEKYLGIAGRLLITCVMLLSWKFVTVLLPVSVALFWVLLRNIKFKSKRRNIIFLTSVCLAIIVGLCIR